MREADIECKVAHSLFQSCRATVAPEAIRLRQLGAENWQQKLESAVGQGIDTDALVLKYNGQKQK
jgi:hypothetical protein